MLRKRHYGYRLSVASWLFLVCSLLRTSGMRPVTDDDEIVWNDVLEAEMENEYQQMPRR